MAKKTTDKRRLIKFSNYSMCITLPKWVIDQLEWKKGDELTLTTDVKSGKITLFKDKNSTPVDEATETGLSQETTPSEPPTDELQPIPKLRW